MKARDKIYIHTRTKPYLSLTWSEMKEKNATNEEYIRKSTVLDIIKNAEHLADAFYKIDSL